jgi:acetolactate synthase I/II/III large subunit
LKDFDHIVLAGARLPVGFFAYPGVPDLHSPPGVISVPLCSPGQNAEAALKAVAEDLKAPKVAHSSAHGTNHVPQGKPTSLGLGEVLAAVLPEHAIVADEGISFATEFYAGSKSAKPHDWMMVTGGAIGYGMPCATGAALAGRGRRVINLQADGSALYTIQALWTQAREQLPVTTVILNNRKYQILLGEYQGVGATPGPTAHAMMDLGNPDIDFVGLAKSFGVPAKSCDTLEDCAALMQNSFREAGPFLIDLKL